MSQLPHGGLSSLRKLIQVSTMPIEAATKLNDRQPASQTGHGDYGVHELPRSERGGIGRCWGLRRGFISGFDARFGNWRGGLAAGYTNSHNNTDDRGGANVESGHVAAYGGSALGALNLRGGGAYSFHSIDTSRTIAFPGFFDRATARYEGGTGQLFGEAGYSLSLGRVAIEPFAGAAWVHLQTDAFNETGGLAALNVAANRFEVGYSTIGARAATMIPLNDNMILVPRASAAWQHAFSNVTPTAAAAFLSTGTAFTVSGVPIARDGLLSEAGLDLHIGRNAVLGVSYVGQFAANVQDHAAKGKFSWKF
jgi:subtilase-type serine protease